MRAVFESKRVGARSAIRTSSSARRIGGARASARGVATMPPAARTSRASPVTVRSRLSAWLIALCVMPTFSAARVTFFASRRASRARRRFRSIDSRCSSCMLDMCVIHCTHGAPRRMLVPRRATWRRPRMEVLMFAIAGVSGHTGKVAAETLLGENKPVRVIVRSAAKGEEWTRRGAEVAVAELDDVDALTRALRGAAGAYLLLPPQMASTDARGDNAKRTRTYVKAIDASGVGHVVFLSSIGAQHASGTGPILSIYDAEVALGACRANVTFLRAAYFLENWGGSLYALGQGALPTFLTAGRAIPMVATEDIGKTAARLLVEGGKGHSIVELSGPRDYSPIDIAATLTHLTGKT